MQTTLRKTKATTSYQVEPQAQDARAAEAKYMRTGRCKVDSRKIHHNPGPVLCDERKARKQVCKNRLFKPRHETCSQELMTWASHVLDVQQEFQYWYTRHGIGFHHLVRSLDTQEAKDRLWETIATKHNHHMCLLTLQVHHTIRLQFLTPKEMLLSAL